uniref:Uncharacterized protein n=1 Tax=Ranid herpesvirus 4 TaxID=2849006 RepID=A0A8F3CIK1_9VIRU|nr:MAG: hypothetical protein [Ranid herpesvirus 4]
MHRHTIDVKETAQPITIQTVSDNTVLQYYNLPLHIKQLIAILQDERSTSLSTVYKFNGKLHRSLIRHKRKSKRLSDLRATNIPLTALTMDPEYFAVRNMILDDTVLQLCIEQIINTITPSGNLIKECLSCLPSTERATIITQHIIQLHPAVDAYFNTLCQNYMLWFIALGAIPYCYVQSSILTDSSFHYQTVLQSRRVFQEDECVYMKDQENNLRLNILRTIQSIPKPSKLLKDYKFLEQMGLHKIGARMLCEMCKDLELSALSVYQFICIIRNLNKGLLPYIPMFIGSTVDIVYDRQTGITKACDADLNLYNVWVDQYPLAYMFPNSIARANIDRSKQYVTITRSLMAVIQESSTRVALVTRAPPVPRESNHVGINNETHTDANNDMLSLRENIRKQELILQYFRQEKVQTSGEEGPNIAMVKKTLQNEDTQRFLESLAKLQSSAAIKNALIKTLEAYRREDTYSAEKYMETLSPELRKLVRDNVVMKIPEKTQPSLIPKKSDQIRVMDTDDYSKLICQFQGHNPSDLLNDTMHGWVQFWLGQLTASMNFKHKTTIDYRGNKTFMSNTKDLPRSTIKTTWEALLRKAGFTIPMTFQGQFKYSVEDTYKIANVLSEKAKVHFFSDQFGVQATDIKTEDYIYNINKHAAIPNTQITQKGLKA